MIALFILILNIVKCFVGVSLRIVGGQEVHKNPGFVVELLKKEHGNYTFFCGGTLYKERYVVTAAHCVMGNKQENIKQIKARVNGFYTKVDDTNVKSLSELVI